MLDDNTREMIEYRARVVDKMIAEEESHKEGLRFGANLYYPEKRSLNITVDVDALKVLSRHFKSQVQNQPPQSLEEDQIVRLIKGAQENYQKADYVDAAVELQIVVNRINRIIEERFRRCQDERQ